MVGALVIRYGQLSRSMKSLIELPYHVILWQQNSQGCLEDHASTPDTDNTGYGLEHLHPWRDHTLLRCHSL